MTASHHRWRVVDRQEQHTDRELEDPDGNGVVAETEEHDCSDEARDGHAEPGTANGSTHFLDLGGVMQVHRNHRRKRYWTATRTSSTDMPVFSHFTAAYGPARRPI